MTDPEPKPPFVEFSNKKLSLCMTGRKKVKLKKKCSLKINMVKSSITNSMEMDTLLLDFQKVIIAIYQLTRTKSKERLNLSVFLMRLLKQ